MKLKANAFAVLVLENKEEQEYWQSMTLVEKMQLLRSLGITDVNDVRTKDPRTNDPGVVTNVVYLTSPKFNSVLKGAMDVMRDTFDKAARSIIDPLLHDQALSRVKKWYSTNKAALKADVPQAHQRPVVAGTFVVAADAARKDIVPTIQKALGLAPEDLLCVPEYVRQDHKDAMRNFPLSSIIEKVDQPATVTKKAKKQASAKALKAKVSTIKEMGYNMENEE